MKTKILRWQFMWAVLATAVLAGALVAQQQEPQQPPPAAAQDRLACGDEVAAGSAQRHHHAQRQARRWGLSGDAVSYYTGEPRDYPRRLLCSG